MVEAKKTKLIAVGLLMLFCVIGIFTAIHYNNELLWGSFEKFDNDDVKYLRSAKTLIETGKFTYNYPDKSTVYIMPGIVFTLVPFVKLFGMEMGANYFRIFSAIIQSITIYMIFLIALKFFDKKVAILSVLLNIFYLPNINSSLQVLTDTMFLFFMTLFITYAVYFIDKKIKRTYFVLGIIWAVASLYRATAVVLPILLIIILKLKDYKIKECLKMLLIFLIPFILIMSPWWIRNYKVFNRISIFTLASGNPRLFGAFINNEYDTALVKTLNYDNLELDVKDEIKKNEVEKELVRRVQKYNWENNFFEYLKWNTIDKIIYNLTLPYFKSKLYGISYEAAVVQNVVYLFIALYGLITKRNKYNFFILGLVICFLIIHLPFLVWPRYMYPIFPFLIVVIASVIVGRKKYFFEEI